MTNPLDPTLFRPDAVTPETRALNAPLHNMPPALFTVGTADALLDDRLFMYARWLAAGNAAELAIYPGGAHGFRLFPSALADQAAARMDEFLCGLSGARPRL